MKDIIVIGGGVSGFLAANLFLSFGNVGKVTHIFSKDVPPIGVGEGTTPNFVQTLAAIGVELPEFMAATNATIKRGVHYKGWWSNDFINPFAPRQMNREELSSYMSAILNKEAFNAEALSGIHFDCFKAIDFFKAKANKDSRYNHISGFAEVDYSPEKVQSVSVNGETITADYYVNAAQAGLFGEEYEYVNDYNNTAVVTHVDKKGDFHYTEALAMSAGWRWAIPLRDKVGYGYVFDSSEINVDDATEELQKSVGQEIDTRVVRYQSKYAKKAFLDNACTLGLAQNFLDPLDTLSLLTTSLTLQGINFHFLSGNTYDSNISYINLINDCKLHLNAQYKLSVGTTPYWVKRQNKDVRIADKSNSLTMHTLSGRGL